MREENQNTEEFTSESEFSECDELTEQEEFTSESEFSEYDEFNSSTSDEDEDDEDEDDDDEDEEEEEEDSSGSEGSSAGGGIAATAAVVAVIVLVLNVAISNLTAKFVDLNPFGTLFKFNITVSMLYEKTEEQVVDFDNVDTGLVLVVSKDKVVSTTGLVTGVEGLEYSVSKIPRTGEGNENKYDVVITFTGQVEGLSENSRYSVRIIGDDSGKTVTYDSQTIKTTSRVSEIRGVNSVCTCTTDGKFRFTLDYDDENGFYSGFKYEFRNTDGGVVRSGTIENPKAEQIIEKVDELPGTAYELVIYCESAAGADLEADNKATTFNDGALTVTVNRGVITISQKVEI